MAYLPMDAFGDILSYCLGIAYNVLDLTYYVLRLTYYVHDKVNNKAGKLLTFLIKVNVTDADDE